MIQEEYVSFKTAKLLKRKGFCQDLPYFYNERGEVVKNDYNMIKAYPYITQQMAMRWLREKHHIHIMIDCLGSSNYLPTIQITNSSKDIVVEGSESRIGGNGFDTYEEAVEHALQYAIKNYKNLIK